jgi:hypothetical protein
MDPVCACVSVRVSACVYDFVCLRAGVRADGLCVSVCALCVYVCVVCVSV